MINVFFFCMDANQARIWDKIEWRARCKYLMGSQYTCNLFIYITLSMYYKNINITLPVELKTAHSFKSAAKNAHNRKYKVAQNSVIYSKTKISISVAPNNPNKLNNGNSLVNQLYLNSDTRSNAMLDLRTVGNFQKNWKNTIRWLILFSMFPHIF